MLKKLAHNFALLWVLFSSSLFANAQRDCFETKTQDWFILEVQDCTFSSNNIIQFRDLFNSDESVDTLILYHINIEPENAALLANMLATNKTINSLYLISANMGSGEIENIATNSKIRSLSLIGNHIDDKGFISLNSNTSIENLYFGESSVSTKVLNDFIDQHPLEAFGLYNIKLNDADFRSVFQHINSSHLKNLFIDGIAIEDLTPINQLHQLRFLHVNNLRLNNESMVAIGQLDHLQDLWLTDNEISPSGISNLANLKNLGELRIINQTAINSQIGDDVAFAIENLPKLRSVSLTGQNISDAGAASISRNFNFELVNLKNNQISDEGAIALANNPSIYSLNLNFNRIGDAGGIALAQKQQLKSLEIAANLLSDPSAYAFAKTTSLNTLLIKNNHFSLDAITALKNNTHIQYLQVDDFSNKRSAHDTNPPEYLAINSLIPVKYLWSGNQSGLPLTAHNIIVANGDRTLDSSSGYFGGQVSYN